MSLRQALWCFVRPTGAVDVARKSYKGLSVRVVPYYDGVNDISNYRLDVLYGVKVVDNRLAVRMGGGATGTKSQEINAGKYVD